MSDCPHDPYAHRYTHCLPFGAQPCSASAATLRTHFRLWAPASAEVRLEFGIDGAAEPAIEMAPAGNGWFETFAECGPGARYRYRLDDTLLIPDPASRSQPEGIGGASEVIDPRAFEWRNTFWRGRPWEEIALYAIRPGALGGYDAVRQRLPQLARLGVTAIELLASPDATHDSLPFAPVAAYGGPNALKALIDAAHGLGLAVLLDLDYARFGAGNEALRRYAVPFFQLRDDPQQAPLALEHPEVCDFFCDNALYWIEEYRCDGLRLREADRISNAGLREIADRARAALSSDRLVHFVLGSERHPSHLADTHFDAQWNECGERALHRLTGRAAHPYREAISTRQTIHTLARALTAGGSAYQRVGDERGGNDITLPDHLAGVVRRRSSTDGRHARGGAGGARAVAADAADPAGVRRGRARRGQRAFRAIGAGGARQVDRAAPARFAAAIGRVAEAGRWRRGRCAAGGLAAWRRRIAQSRAEPVARSADARACAQGHHRVRDAGALARSRAVRRVAALCAGRLGDGRRQSLCALA